MNGGIWRNPVLQRNSVKKNLIYHASFQVLLLLIPFITTPYVSRVLGAENIGRYSYASAMVTYFTLVASLGTTIYGQRKVAYFRDNRDELSQVFWNTVSLRFLLSAFSLILYCAYVFLFEGLELINAIVSINILNVALDLSWYYQGVEDFKSVVLRNFVVRLACLSGIFIFVRTRNDTWKYVLILTLSQVLGSVSMWRSIGGNIKLVKKIHPFDGFKEILLLFLPSIAIQVYTILDKSMIGWITASNYANGCYEQSERIARLALSVVTSVGTVVLPRVANLFHGDDLDEAKRYVYLACRLVCMLSIPIMFGLSVVSSLFIPLFLGDGFNDAICLLCIFSMLVPVVSLAYVIGLSYLIPTGQQNVYTISVTIAAIVNFFINLLLIPIFGAIGAAIASVVAEIIGVSIQLIYCSLKKQLSLKMVFVPAWRYVIAGMIMFFVTLCLKHYLTTSVLSLMVLICVGVATYSIMLVLLKDSFLLENLGKVFRNGVNRNER